jgi:NFU1 iron-sulfur cluster scaffold homolog, mitochondrial
MTLILFSFDIDLSDESATWQLMKPDIYGGIMDFFATGQEIVAGDYVGVRDTEILDTDSDVVAMIKVSSTPLLSLPGAY